MTAATDKQVTYLQALVSKALAAQTPRLMTGQNAAMRMFANTALLLALPTAQTAAEASEQIDALKSGIEGYAQSHQEWAQRVLSDVSVVLGRGPVVTSDAGAEMTPAQWVAYVREALG